MINYTENIRKISGDLLKSGKVDVVIGYKKGTLPGINEPFLARTPEDAQKLVWDSQCRLNLANYLTNRKENVGIVAKGCDSRNIATHIIEHRVTREQVTVIGVPCTGMTDKNKLRELAGGEITALTEKDGIITVTSRHGEKTVEKQDLLQSNCANCLHRNPVINDIPCADPVPEINTARNDAEIKAIEAMSPADKWAFFEDLLSTCTRCYACKNACPLCYCPTCFVDESRPQWVGKGDDPIDVRTYHTLRAFHCAGRCTDCGACEAACPMNIKVRLLTGKMEKSCFERYGWEAGLNTEVRPALDTFTLHDPEEFIK
ncbi:MAG: 4Fe-4S ferredoxin [Proteobacteria bacterium]|nr:4Fe-4S ferredoxin [Pseudomonadota bacterium]